MNRKSDESVSAFEMIKNMTNDLMETLRSIIRGGLQENLGFSIILNDYSNYHSVFVAMGSIFAIGFLFIGLLAHSKFGTSRRRNQGSSFETKVGVFFAVLGMGLGLLMGLMVAANASNVLNPKTGFSLLVGTLGHPAPESELGQLRQVYNVWLQSGHPQIPALIQEKIAERLTWQQPKAVLCGLLLAVLVTLTVVIWRGLLKRSRLGQLNWTPHQKAMLAAGIALIPAVLLLVVMFIGNTQAAIAPITITMLYG